MFYWLIMGLNDVWWYMIECMMIVCLYMLSKLYFGLKIGGIAGSVADLRICEIAGPLSGGGSAKQRTRPGWLLPNVASGPLSGGLKEVRFCLMSLAVR